MVGLRQLGALVAVGLAAAVVPISTLSRGSAVSGRWRPLPRAPVSLIDQGAVSVWAGKQLIVVGRLTTYPQSGVTRNYVDAAYNPATGSWRRLPPPPSSVDGIYGYNAVWTGKEMLVWGQAIGVAFNPATNRWRLLPRSPMDGAALVVWTGREMIGWGGGCCGEAWSNGAAYNPSTNSWRSLAISPLHGAQEPVGAWDGRELIALVSGDNPQNGKPWPARLARAAAYNPTTDTWRRIAPPPATRDGATAVWDGHDVLLVGGYSRSGAIALPWKLARIGFGYNPATNHWRRLAPMQSGRRDFAAAWTGKRLMIWGGTTAAGGGLAHGGGPQSSGLSYDPATDSWSPLPPAPLRPRTDPTAVWTGHSLIVWGGAGLPNYRGFTDGAFFTPATH